MVVNIGVIGSCASRDIFYTKINPYYKDFFNVSFTANRTSLISSMSESFLFDDKLIKPSSESSINEYQSSFLEYDLKRFLKRDLLNKDFQYIILDNYFEVRFGVIELDNNIYVTNNDWDLPCTSLFNKLNIKNEFKMMNDSKEFFKLWSKNCDLFFEFLEDNCPDVQVILNEVRAASNILKKDGNIEINNQFLNIANEFNPHLAQLDEYISKNFSVEILEFDSETLADEQHIWGSGIVHYENKFYDTRLDMLKEIAFKS